MTTTPKGSGYHEHHPISDVTDGIRKHSPTLQEVRNKLDKGWAVNDIGTPNTPEYLITHDGAKDDGTFGAGHAFKVSNLSDVALAVQHFGRIPES